MPGHQRRCEMRAKTFCVLAGVSAPLIVAGSASAGYNGIVAESFQTQFVPSVGGTLWVVRLYVVFDRPDDEMVSVASGTFNRSNIFVKNGKFYQDPDGQALTAPLSSSFPGQTGALAYDTFVTIGVSVDDPLTTLDDVSTTPGLVFENDCIFCGYDGSVSYFVLPSGPGQGGNGQPDEDGRVLIFQGSFINDGIAQGLAGDLFLEFTSNGVPGQSAFPEFDHQIPAPGIPPLLGIAGLMGTLRRPRSRARSGRKTASVIPSITLSA